MQWYLEYRSQYETNNPKEVEEQLKNENKTNRNNRMILNSRAGKEYLYVFGLLLSQGKLKNLEDSVKAY
jgi:hypothetical protein